MDGWGNARVGRCSEKHWTGLDWGDWYGVVLMIGMQVLSFSTESTLSPTSSRTVCCHYLCGPLSAINLYRMR